LLDTRKMEIQKGVIRAMSAFGVDRSLSHQSMSFVGLKQMRRDIPLEELVEVLKSMEGVILDTESYQVRIPTSYFTH
jgi:hypothetical protein